jgi:hypothetical protein
MPATATATAERPAAFASAVRANLAAAIARLDQMSAHLADTRRRAEAGTGAASAAAWQARADAEAALREAAGSSGEKALARALGAPSPTIDELQANLDAARARFDAVGADHALVRDEIARLTRAVDFARNARDQALAAALAPSAAELLAELTAARRRILILENTVFAIRKLAPIDLPMDWSTPAERRTPADWEPDGDVLATWREAIAKIAVDASAALPGDDD